MWKWCQNQKEEIKRKFSFAHFNLIQFNNNISNQLLWYGKLLKETGNDGDSMDIKELSHVWVTQTTMNFTDAQFINTLHPPTDFSGSLTESKGWILWLNEAKWCLKSATLVNSIAYHHVCLYLSNILNKSFIQQFYS